MPVKIEVTKQAEDRAKGFGMSKQLERKKNFFINDPSHPSLHFELLQPKQLGRYSFRLNDQYRAIVIKNAPNEYTIIDVVDYH